jgi:RNA recognition motif-containing protein
MVFSRALTFENFFCFFCQAEVQIMVDAATQRSRNFGFVTFESTDSVKVN